MAEGGEAAGEARLVSPSSPDQITSEPEAPQQAVLKRLRSSELKEPLLMEMAKSGGLQVEEGVEEVVEVFLESLFFLNLIK